MELPDNTRGLFCAQPDGSVSCEDVFAFMESEMTNKEKIISASHILGPDSLQFPLVGREEAIRTAMECFNSIIVANGATPTDRKRQVIPFCSGISGLGKTRMLEESGTIFKEMKLDSSHIFRVIVPYYNGYLLQPVEDSMPIEASFSWRLLYRFFLDWNCDFDFPCWFEYRLPRNESQLRLNVAIEVIGLKLRQIVQHQERLFLFLGIDDYQKVKHLRAPRKDPDIPLQRELMDTVGAFLCSNSSNLVVLPMFAGTDIGVSGSDSHVSSYVTKRLPMDLLSLDQVFHIVENTKGFAEFLQNAQIRRDLFLLGGLPRWIANYLLRLKDDSPGVTSNSIQKSFLAVYQTFVLPYISKLESEQSIRLAVFAILRQQIREDDQFDVELKWSKLRDAAVCLLLPCTSGACDVRVPYTLLNDISAMDTTGCNTKTQAENAFVKALKDMSNMVDSQLFDLSNWQSWVLFGACFYAVRINALLVLGHSTVTLEKLLPGMKMTEETRAITVKLAPASVFQCAESFDSSTPRLISPPRYRSVGTDWTSNGCIAVNKAVGDIFFALKNAFTDNVVVFVDQRKREFGPFQPSDAVDYLGKLSSCPDFLVKNGAHLIRGIMNCGSSSDLEEYAVPHAMFLLSQEKTEKFYGTLAYHPACSLAGRE